jgi:hypothetical protein
VFELRREEGCAQKEIEVLSLDNPIPIIIPQPFSWVACIIDIRFTRFGEIRWMIRKQFAA